MSKILITGGTGLVGTRLIEILKEKKHKINILTRNPQQKNHFKWDVKNNFIDEKAFKDIDYIIHLAGAGIADQRWTTKRKKTILESRVKTTNLLFEKITSLNIKLKGFISASGIGYYGAVTSQKIFDEDDNPGKDFLGKVCIEWEEAANQFKNLNVPVTILRTGIVLAKKGGALEKMKTPIISPLGSGNQYLPWIHIDDLCHVYSKAIESDFTGIYNAVSPEHHTSKTFSKILAEVIKRKFIKIPVPSIVLKIIFGEMSIILLEGSKISSKKIEKNGYSFRFKSLKKALLDLES